MHVSLKSIEGDQISQNVKVDERYNYQSYILLNLSIKNRFSLNLELLVFIS